MAKQNITGPLREQSNWEQQDENRLGFIKNKPFYDTRKTAPFTIEWDGQIDDRKTVDLFGIKFVKMSDATPTADEVLQGEMSMCFPNEGGAVYTIPMQDIPITQSDDGFATEDNGLMVIPSIAELGKVVVESGVWFKADWNEDSDPYYVSKFYLPSVTTGELKTLSPKFLPTVELITPLDLESGAQGIALSEKDSNALDQMFAEGGVFIGKFFSDGEQNTLLFQSQL